MDINAAISDTYSEMRSSLLSIFRQVNIPEEECKDLVQDVFVRLLRIDTLHIETIRGITVTIAMRMRTDYLRRQAFLHKLYAKAATADIYDAGYSDTSFDAREIAKAERDIVGHMTSTNRRIYELSGFEDKSYDEIADIMDMSYRAVESRVYRTRMEVRGGIRKLFGT